MNVARSITHVMLVVAMVVVCRTVAPTRAADENKVVPPNKQSQTKETTKSKRAERAAAKKQAAKNKKNAKSAPAPERVEGAQENPQRYTTSKKHDPNGIGKFYMGREIAHVMGFLAIPWLERPTRENEEQPSKLVEALGLRPGMVVADIGAGSGVLSLMMAGPIGPEGRILAVDVQQEMLDRLSAKCKLLQVTNIEPVLGTEKSPRLKPSSVDLALMVDVYHEFAFPYEMMAEIASSVKPGGRVVFVEYRREDPNIRAQIKLVHTMSEEQVKKEILLPEFELKHTATIGVLPMQHIIVFTRLEAGEAAPQAPARSEQEK